MKQRLSTLQKHLKEKDEELSKSETKREELTKKLASMQVMINSVKEQLKERERGLKIKDDSLFKMREQTKHLESFKFVLDHKVQNLEEERDPIQKQVNSLKSDVREMYSEFVREFRRKQKIDQQLGHKNMLSETLQKENVDIRNQLAQLKKSWQVFAPGC